MQQNAGVVLFTGVLKFKIIAKVLNKNNILFVKVITHTQIFCSQMIKCFVRNNLRPAGFQSYVFCELHAYNYMC